jgi:hypothetical protein
MVLGALEGRLGKRTPKRDEMIKVRVEAYEAAKRGGSLAYGAKGEVGKAVDVAATACGLKNRAGIVAALRAVEHIDIVPVDVARRTVRRDSQLAKRIAKTRRDWRIAANRSIGASLERRAKAVAPKPEKASKQKRAATAKSKRSRKAKPVVPVLATNGAIIASRYVDDPFGGAPIRVQVNQAEHPAELLRARGSIDDVQYQVAGKFRAAYEAANVGAVRGIDPTREHVDGGMIAMPVVSAGGVDLLRYYRSLTTQLGYVVLAGVIGEGRGLAHVAGKYAEMRKGGERGAHGHVLGVLIEALDDLAVALGMRPKAEHAANQFARKLALATAHRV